MIMAQQLHLLGTGQCLVYVSALEIAASKEEEGRDLTERSQRTKSTHFFHQALL